MNRRDFLKLSGAFGVIAYTGCHGIALQTLKIGCATPKYEGKLRVGQHNIANARGNIDKLMVTRSKEEVEHHLDQLVWMNKVHDFDIFCMNEVDYNSTRTANIDQAEYIAKKLCFPYIIRERMFSIPGWFDMGNAVISKYPLKVNSYQQYGTSFKSRVRNHFKSYVDFDVDLGNASLNFVLTHLHAESRKMRFKQIDTLVDHLDDKEEPFVLLGDLNTGPGRPDYEELMGSGLIHNPRAGINSYPSDNPRKSIDHIFVSEGLGIDNYQVASIVQLPSGEIYKITISDHAAMMADIFFNPC